ncbi:unnamed protein product [Durusdinium trenchii]|uniref:Uncharacterized protein n=2 Tax=Durusdinium trenchii TaxID=1381693 RepID=A0ABP0RAG8_9DINO
MQAMRMHLQAKKQELSKAMAEQLQAAGDGVRDRARRKVDAVRRKCQVELKTLRAKAIEESEAREKEDTKLRDKLLKAEEALRHAAAQEREELKTMREAGEAELARIAAQFEEDTARQLQKLEASHCQQEEMLVMREEHSSQAQGNATAQAWKQRLADAELAAAEARAQLCEASQVQEKLWLQSSQRVEELLDESSKLEEETPILSKEVTGGSKRTEDVFHHEVRIITGKQPLDWTCADSPTGQKGLSPSPATSLVSDGGQSHTANVTTTLPLVYAAALEGIETHGWGAVYPPDDPPAWTILHWAAMEGRLDVCRRLVAAGANPLCEDERGWTPIFCAEQAGENEVLELLCACTEKADQLLKEKQGLPPIPPVIAASVEAVENYGWQAMHGGQNDWTALHWAAAEGRQVLCARLLRDNADPAQADDTGKSALDYARESGHQSTWLLLWQVHQEQMSKGKSSTKELAPTSWPKLPTQSYASYPQSLLLPSKP